MSIGLDFGYPLATYEVDHDPGPWGQGTSPMLVGRRHCSPPLRVTLESIDIVVQIGAREATGVDRGIP